MSDAIENLKLPIALVLAMFIQVAAGVWWVSQQAATITDLEETVSQLGSRMAIEDNVNLKRDVQQNKDDLDDMWHDVNSLAISIMKITDLQQRVSLLEKTLEFIGRDHDSLLDPRKKDMH